jgi:hypothetical protein
VKASWGDRSAVQTLGKLMFGPDAPQEMKMQKKYKIFKEIPIQRVEERLRGVFRSCRLELKDIEGENDN